MKLKKFSFNFDTMKLLYIFAENIYNDKERKSKGVEKKKSRQG